MRGAVLALLVILSLVFAPSVGGAGDIHTAIWAARGDAIPVLPLLQRVAEERAVEIAQDFSHYGPGADASRSVLTGWAWGEVIVWNTYPADLTVASAIQQWLGSPDHRAILLGHWAGFGAAEVDTPSGHYFAAIFGTPPRPVARPRPIPHRARPVPTPAPAKPDYWPTPSAHWRMMPC